MSQRSGWGHLAADRFARFGDWLRQRGLLFHDDRLADFGGNDGTSAYAFLLAHGIRPTVVECEPKRVNAARQNGLPVIQAFLEDLSAIADKHFDYGFCSHTLEHTRDPEKALRELARVTKRMCMFVVPLESEAHARDNPAHTMYTRNAGPWRRLINNSGWRIIKSKTYSSCIVTASRTRVEFQCLAVPR